MSLPTQQGQAADVPTERAPLSVGAKEARLRVLARRTGRDIAFLRRLPEDTLRRMFAARDNVIPHRDEATGAVTWTRDIVAGRGVPGGVLQAARGTDSAANAAKGRSESAEAQEAKAQGPQRDASGRFVSRGSK